MSGGHYCWCRTCGLSKLGVVAGEIKKDSPQDKHCRKGEDKCYK